jgi:PAS domain S-box-containing protein
MRILVVEDDPLVAQAMRALLVSHHYVVDMAKDGQEGLEMAEAYAYDLLVLDVGLPQLDGLSLCRRLRSRQIQTPILLLTGQKSAAHAKAIALNTGADDYVTKPFDTEELLARVKSLLRRGNLKSPPVLKWGALVFDPGRLQVSYGDCLLYLTPKEYGLLEVLLRQAPNIVSNRTLLDQGWNALDTPGEETVRTHIKELRKKLKAAGAAEDFIKTVHRQGYRINPLYGNAVVAAVDEPSVGLRMAELKAVNEELRITLEQLQTAQTQLQQKNQELTDTQKALIQEQQQLLKTRNQLARQVTEGSEKLTEANDSLQQQQTQWQALFNHALEAIFIADDAGQYTDANPAACKLLGMARDDLLGCGIADFADPDVDVIQVWQQFLQQGQLSGEFRLHCPNGQIKDTEFNAIANFVPGRHLSILRDISGHKQLELSLQQSEAQLSRILSNAVAAIGEFSAYPDRTYVHRFMSIGCEAIYGYSQAEMTREQDLWLSRVEPEDVETVIIPAYKQIFAEKRFTLEYRFRDKTDTLRWISETLTSQWDEAASCWQVTTVAVDISDRKQAELALQQQIQQEQLLADISRDISQSLDLNHVLSRTVNRVRALLAADRVLIFRFRPDWQGDVIMESVSDQWSTILATTIVDPCLEERMIQPYRQGQVSVLTDIDQPELEPCYVEFLKQFQVKASLTVPILQGSALWGLLIAHQCSAPRQWQVTEITILKRLATNVGMAILQAELHEQVRQELAERQHMQTVLQESEELFRTLSAAAPVGIVQTNADGRCLYVNAYWQQMSGLPLGKSLGSGWLQAIHPEDRTRISQIWESHLHQQAECEAEFRLLTPQGETRWVVARSTTIHSATEETIGNVCIFADITAQKQATQQIQQQAMLLDIATDAIFVRDLDHRILYWNHGAEQLFGWSAAEALGQPANEFLPCDQTQIASIMPILLAQDSWQGEIQDWTKTGERVTVAARWTLMRNEAGQPQAILSVETNITEQKIREAQFYLTQRLESLGTLASGIAHDLNNILTPILATAQMLQFTQKGLDDKGLELLKLLETSAKRGSNLVKQILSVTRASQGERVAVDLSALLQEEVAMIRQSFPKAIEIQADFPPLNQTEPTLGMIFADPTYLHQVLLNLCINARDAMPAGGTLTISATKVFIDEAVAAQNLNACVGQYIVITVADTGSGIPPEVQEHMFDPFFTTKERGKGTGLGLATVHELVKANQGFLQVFSEVGQGTRFKVYFPILEAKTLDQEQPQPLSAESPGHLSGFILVVEDDDSVRDLLESLLENQHYQTILARDGAEALEKYRQNQNEIRLVVTDIMMPNLDGIALIRHLKALNPELKVIALSGVFTHEENSLEIGADSFLGKPFELDTLISRIKGLLS